MSAAHAMDGMPTSVVCLHDPCWCGRALRGPTPAPKGFKPWTQEGEDRFFADQAAARARREENPK